MKSQDGNMASPNFGFGEAGTKTGRGGSKPVRASADFSGNKGPDDESKIQPKGTRFQSKDR